MKIGMKRFTVLMMVAVLTLAGVAGVTTAAPGTIEAGTDTSDRVFMTDGKTIQTNYTANDSIDYTLALNDTAMTADEIAMNVTTTDGDKYYSFAGTWDSWDAGDGAGNDYQHNVSGGELADVPMDINENVTLNVTYWNESASSPSPTTIQVYIENGDVRSVQEVKTGAASTEVDDEAKAPFYRRADYWDDDNTFTKVDVDDTVSVNGSATDVTYYLADTNTSDAFANTTEDLSDSGAFTYMVADVDADSANPVPVFYKASPDWYDASEHGTYAVYNPTDDSVTFETEDTEFEGATTSDITFTNDVYRVGDTYKVFKLAGGFSGDGVSAVTGMML